MSEEQSPTGKEGASADARRRTHQMGCASCARPYVGTDLIRIVGSWVLPLIVQHSAFGALVKAAIPKIETSARVPALLGGFAPALGMTETVGRSLMAGQFVVWGLTNLPQAQVLVGLSVWRSLVLSDLGVSTGVLLASCTAESCGCCRTPAVSGQRPCSAGGPRSPISVSGLLAYWLEQPPSFCGASQRRRASWSP